MHLNLSKTLISLILILLLNRQEVSSHPVRPGWSPGSQGKTICNNADRLVYLGEIKGKSYIKMSMCPANGKAFDDNTIIYTYKGRYYEAISGKTYPLIGYFDRGTHMWNIKSIGNHNKTIAIFSGKESREGEITGTWKNKEGIFNFYLRRENSNLL